MIARVRARALAAARGGRRLFAGLDFDLGPGEALAVTGPNGSGKTTLLRVLAGLCPLEAGELGFEGPAGPLDPDAARGEGLHLLGHRDGLKSQRTVGEELAFWSAYWSASLEEARAQARAFGLGPLFEVSVGALSAGQRRRLALARLIAAPRGLWLLDEPMAPLDAAARARFGEAMSAHLAGGGLLVAATHDPLPIPAARLEIPAP